MKKLPLLIALSALLLIGAGLWSIPPIRAFLIPSSSDATSRYLTGTQVIPTAAISPSTAPCDPQQIPGVAEDPADGIGSPAITPHLCSIPTFTEDDMRQFIQHMASFTSFRIQQVSAHFIITRVLFVTNQIANDLLNADTGVSSPSLIVGYVEVYGDFTVISPFGNKGQNPPLLHHGQVVLDGVTGNVLSMGVVA